MILLPMRLFCLLLLAACLCLSGYTAQSQDIPYVEETTYAQDIPQVQDSLYRIETNDDNVYVGTIVEQNAELIRLRTEKVGEISIRRKDIKSIVNIDRSKIVAGKLWLDHPQDARYFFAPSGYGLKRGEAYYQNAWIFYNQVSAGVTDYFTLGAGLIPLFLFNGTPTPAWITAKASIPVVRNKFNVGAGALAGTVIGESNAGFGIAFATTTLGSRNSNISIGIGQGFSSEGWAEAPTVNISGIIRASNKAFIMTENYYMNLGSESMLILSAGGRYIIKRTSLDFGLFLPLSSELDVMVALPWLGLTIPLSKVK